MIDILQFAPQIGSAVSVLVVVVLFLRFLAGERKAQRVITSRIEKALHRNTRAYIRSTAALIRVEQLLARMFTPAVAAEQRRAPRDRAGGGSAAVRDESEGGQPGKRKGFWDQVCEPLERDYEPGPAVAARPP